jgi:Protein of unknown function (DUF3300)
MTDKISMKAFRLALCAAPLMLVWNVATVPARAQGAAAPIPAQSQTQNEQFSQGQIAQLVAPIALYPDPLLTQILMASTYPLEVVEAARWSRANSSTKGQALETAMQGQSWDPSVKALTAVPQTLQMMSDRLDWTEQLGDAFLAQQQDVLNAVQTLRAEAQAAGNLKSTPQQVVTAEPVSAGVAASAGQPPIVIQPVNPDVYYVPVYNPLVAYGAWGFPNYQPFYWSPPGFIASNIVSFGAGVAVGAAIWGGCDWWNHNVIINVNRYNIFNRTNINITNNVWVHNPAHRGNVPYRNAAVAERFGRSNEAAARDALRDRVDSERGDAIRRLEGNADNAGRIIAPAMTERRDDDVRKDGGDRLVDRAMPERREIAPERQDARRDFMRSRAQVFRPERRPIGGRFDVERRHRL